MSQSILDIKNIDHKLKAIDESCSEVFLSQITIPKVPARDISVLPICELPDKKGISHIEGQARLLHDLANIELQAMELAFRSLAEYPELPQEFREQLRDLTLSESRHLKLCLNGIRELGFDWGSWPIHLSLWESVDSSDSILDRLLIVHRYLEGSGLDAGQTILRKLSGVSAPVVSEIVKVIFKEEVDHVFFGSHWYRKFCEEQMLDPDHDFKTRFAKLEYRLPRRLEKIQHDVRKQAGFTDSEINFLQNIIDQKKRGMYVKTYSV